MAQDNNKDQELPARLKEAYASITAELAKIIVGQREVIEQLLTALFAQGHCILVGVPGLAKTLLVRTLADILGLTFRRIQFTPDLMPADITGTEILQENRETGDRIFRFAPGPLFAQLILADEINRTPPKTQAALLEAMQEYRVTVGGQHHPLDLPFFVLATQNPIEQEGTYPLPEAQLDRFMFSVHIDYPDAEEERTVVHRTTSAYKAKPACILKAPAILALQEGVRRVPASDHVIDYAVSLARATRTGGGSTSPGARWVKWGAGPRASQYMVLAGKARALLHGRAHLACEDIRATALPVLRHRVIPSFAAEAEGIDAEHIVREILESVKEPDE